MVIIYKLLPILIQPYTYPLDSNFFGQYIELESTSVSVDLQFFN